MTIVHPIQCVRQIKMMSTTARAIVVAGISMAMAIRIRCICQMVALLLSASHNSRTHTFSPVSKNCAISSHSEPIYFLPSICTSAFIYFCINTHTHAHGPHLQSRLELSSWATVKCYASSPLIHMLSILLGLPRNSRPLGNLIS